MTDSRHAIQFLASQETNEDYSETITPPLATRVEGRFAVVQAPGSSLGEPEILSVDPDNRLVHYRYDGSSQSGWARDLVELPPGSATIVGITAFYRDDGTLHAFLQLASAAKLEPDEDAAALIGEVVETVVMVRAATGSWSRVRPGGEVGNVLGRVQQLGVHLDHGGRRFLFGITRSFSPATFFILREQGDGWAVASLQRITTGDAAFFLLAGYASG
ncbi:MAG TPA: hypothetical protein VK034_20805, partial [Enhygromyxa sp.]|nr:hypothetical protein [Enhygromyxa sp.]